MFFYFRIIVLMIAVQGSDAQESCLTIFGTQGLCISVYRCDYIYNKLQLPSITKQEARMIKDSQCGFDGLEPKVCCLGRNQVRRPPILIPSVVPDPPDVKNHPNLRLLDKEKCGLVTESRITGGTRTGLLEFPWMALIAYIVNRNRTEFGCGGTLINKRYVLTAAHCVTGLRSGYVLAGVRVGDHYLNTEIDSEFEDEELLYRADKYQNFFIEYFHFHRGYDKKKRENDIALIRLNGDANLEANNVKPICLPYGDSTMPTSTKPIVTGWGETLTHGSSQELLQVKLDLVPTDKCAMFYRMLYEIGITHKQFCASGDNRKDSCAGDSGGPIQNRKLINEQVKYVQYGIVSFGPMRCGTPDYPGVYTKVAYYMDWILDTIAD